MKRLLVRIAILPLIIGFAVLTSATAQEKKINKSELPAAAQKTVDAQSQGATIRGFST